MNILIVDDEPGTLALVAAAVERLGHRALQAADAEEAWPLFASERPDVVITDWAMPGMDGTELARKIRNDTEPAYTFLMILTGQADENAAREAMRAGADDVLAKPLEPAELERKLIAAERVTAMHRRMLEDARRDALTGAGNRLRLIEDLTATCARVERYGHAYCIAHLRDRRRRRGDARGRTRARQGDPCRRRAVPLRRARVRRAAARAGARHRPAGRRAAAPGRGGERGGGGGERAAW